MKEQNDSNCDILTQDAHSQSITQVSWQTLVVRYSGNYRFQWRKWKQNYFLSWFDQSKHFSPSFRVTWQRYFCGIPLVSADSPLLGDMSTRAPVWKVFEKHFWNLVLIGFSLYISSAQVLQTSKYGKWIIICVWSHIFIYHWPYKKA